MSQNSFKIVDIQNRSERFVENIADISEKSIVILDN